MSTGHASPETHPPPNHLGRRPRSAPEWAQSSAPPVDTSTAAVGMQQPQLKWLTTAYRGLLFWSQGYPGDTERAPAPRAREPGRRWPSTTERSRRSGARANPQRRP